tara:strand:- start:10051 stop:10755 length:705 start_codon:yes stop_codon:yes gene_type:complete
MVSICTVLTGTKYDVDVVNKLYSSLKKHTIKDFKFYCYTNHTGFDYNINIIPITTKNKKLQWYKLDYFKKDIIDEEDIILMDIDMDIVGNVDFLFEDNSLDEFRGTHRFWWRWREDRDNKKFALSGSVYKFKNGQHQYIVDTFEENISYWEEFFINKGITHGPVNGEQHFVQKMLEDNNTKVTMFPEKHIVKWNNNDFLQQTKLEYAYEKYTKNNYIKKQKFNTDVRIVHYAGA